MKKIKYMLCGLVLCMLFLTGCGNDEEKIIEGTGIYYLNTEGTGLVKEKYNMKGESPDEKIELLIQEMKKETDSIKYNSPFPEEVEIEKWERSGTILNLYFNVNYNKMDAAKEVLLRAAIVQTLSQVQEVESVSFYVAGQPLVGDNGQEIGSQSTEDFVQNICLKCIFFLGKKKK